MKERHKGQKAVDCCGIEKYWERNVDVKPVMWKCVLSTEGRGWGQNAWTLRKMCVLLYRREARSEKRWWRRRDGAGEMRWSSVRWQKDGRKCAEVVDSSEKKKKCAEKRNKEYIRVCEWRQWEERKQEKTYTLWEKTTDHEDKRG